MRPAVFVSGLFAACALLCAPAAAQGGPDRWMLNSQVGPAFGTFAKTSNFDARGYSFNENISLIGEFGGLSHAPFEKVASVAPTLAAPDVFTDSKIHENGSGSYYNLIVAPKASERITPFLTGGFGAFTQTSVPAQTSQKNIAGTYRCGPDDKSCGFGTTITVTQSGAALEIKTDKGTVANGQVTSENSVSAGPPFNMPGVILADGRTIEWSNGMKWTKP